MGNKGGQSSAMEKVSKEAKRLLKQLSVALFAWRWNMTI
jgi:hypothetical protein